MEKINSILWVQHEDPTKNGYLVVNNKFMPNPDEDYYRKINEKLLKIFSLSIFDEAMVKKYMANSTNHGFRLGSGVFKGVAYRSCFIEKDRNGNWEPFTFWKGSFCLKDFVIDAAASSSALGKTLDAKELEFVEKYIQRIRIRRMIFCTITIVAVIIILILIINFCGNH